MYEPSLLPRRGGGNALVVLACMVVLSVSRAAGGEEATPASATPKPAATGSEVPIELELTGPARADKPTAVDEVVVTAQKRAQDVQDVPISITALTDDFLGESGSTNLLEIGRFAPNVSLNQLTDSRSTAIRIRGIGSDGNNAGIDPAVGVFLDGIYQGRTGLASNMDLADIERVEILRGPQGTLYGKNTAAGAISIVSKRPQLGEWAAFLENNWGSYADRQVRGTVNVPIADDRAAIRLTGYWVQRDGFDTNRYTGEDVNNADRNGARLKTLFKLTDDLELLVWGDYGTEQTSCCVADISSYKGPPSLDVRFPDLAGHTGRPLPPLDQFDRQVDANEQPTNNTQVLGAATELNWTVRDHTVTWLNGYRHFTSLSVLDGDFSSYDAVVQRTDETFAQWSSELRLASPGGERLEYVTGLYFYYQKDDTKGQTGIGPEWLASSAIGPILESGGGADANGFVSNFDTNTHETKSYAAFGQATYSLLESVSLTVGLRAGYETKHRVGSQISGFKTIDAGPFGPDRAADEGLSVFNLSPMGALRWFPTSDSMAFASVSQGFKSGGFNQLRTAGGLNTQFDDEQATDFEVGFRSTWLERMLTLNATAFYTLYDGFQAQAFDGSSFSVTNAGSLVSWGAEADGLIAPHPSVFIGFGLGYNPTKYSDFANSPCTADQNWVVNKDSPLARAPCTQDLTGRQLDNAPKWTASVYASYQHSIGIVPRLDWPLLGYLWADWSYRGETFLQQDLDPKLIQPAYGLLNLRTGVKTEDGHWELAFGVQNVTDQAYNVVGFDVPIVNGFAVINGPPRTFIGTLRYRF